MKSVKLAAFSAIICALFLSAILYSSCQKLDECFETNCKNGAACNKGKCICPSGFYGTLCEYRDMCADVHCVNGGTCVMGTCSCPTGYEGDNCGSETRGKFLNLWSATDRDSTGYISYKVAMVPGAGSVLRVNIGNAFYNHFFNNGVYADLTADSTLMIKRQSPDDNQLYISGQGKYLTDGTIVWNYMVSNERSTDIKTWSCTGTWRKIQ